MVVKQIREVRGESMEFFVTADDASDLEVLNAPKINVGDYYPNLPHALGIVAERIVARPITRKAWRVEVQYGQPEPEYVI